MAGRGRASQPLCVRSHSASSAVKGGGGGSNLWGKPSTRPSTLNTTTWAVIKFDARHGRILHGCPSHATFDKHQIQICAGSERKGWAGSSGGPGGGGGGRRGPCVGKCARIWDGELKYAGYSRDRDRYKKALHRPT